MSADPLWVTGDAEVQSHEGSYSFIRQQPVISLGFGDIEVHWTQPFFVLDGSSETATETEAQCLAERFGQYFKLGACKDDATLDGNPP